MTQQYLKELTSDHDSECELCGGEASSHFETVTMDRFIEPNPAYRYQKKDRPPGHRITDSSGNLVGIVNYAWIEASICDSCAKREPAEIVQTLMKKRVMSCPYCGKEIGERLPDAADCPLCGKGPLRD